MAWPLACTNYRYLLRLEEAQLDHLFAHAASGAIDRRDEILQETALRCVGLVSAI